MISKTKILIWLVVVLLLMNITTIGTIIYKNNQNEKDKNTIGIKSSTDINLFNGRYFRQTLGFNETQMSAFRNINQEFRPNALEITIQIDSIKNEMFTVLKETNPDTNQLNRLSNQIGDLHGLLKYETYRFYLSLKTICTAQQQSELEKSFRPLFTNETITTTTNRHRRRNGNRH